MSTHSCIGLEEPDGTILYVYCHFDGYPSHNGAMLLKHYSNPKKLRELLSLGSLASLQKLIHPTGPHTYREPEKGVCRFFGRDAGDSPESVFRKYANNRAKLDGEWNYLWLVRDGRWIVKGQTTGGVWLHLRQIPEVWEGFGYI